MCTLSSHLYYFLFSLLRLQCKDVFWHTQEAIGHSSGRSWFRYSSNPAGLGFAGLVVKRFDVFHWKEMEAVFSFFIHLPLGRNIHDHRTTGLDLTYYWWRGWLPYCWVSVVITGITGCIVCIQHAEMFRLLKKNCHIQSQRILASSKRWILGEEVVFCTLLSKGKKIYIYIRKIKF